MRVVSTDYFKTKSHLPADHEAVIVRKDTVLAAESLDADSRQLRFTISTSAVDRDNDTISVKGWDLAPYQRNPIVLFGHNMDELPIGKVVELAVEGDALKATIEFVPKDIPEVGPRAESIYQLCKAGFLSATSVGLIPQDYELSERVSKSGKPGLDISSATLVELSLVNLPSNPDALIESRSSPAEVAARKSFVAQNIKNRRLRRLRMIVGG